MSRKAQNLAWQTLPYRNDSNAPERANPPLSLSPIPGNLCGAAMAALTKGRAVKNRVGRRFSLWKHRLLAKFARPITLKRKARIRRISFHRRLKTAGKVTSSNGEVSSRA
jgi:hypothetical protein